MAAFITNALPCYTLVNTYMLVSPLTACNTILLDGSWVGTRQPVQLLRDMLQKETAFQTQRQAVVSGCQGEDWLLTMLDLSSLLLEMGTSQLSAIPVNGRNPPTSLEEAAVHMTINDDGSLKVVDFFMPWEKTQLDGADRDLGTSPLELLPSEFSCGDYKRIGVVTGKSGKTYWLNLDNLGGYQNGPNKLDNIIQVYQNENSVYAGAGVYPLEGGYIYINGK